MMSAKLGPLCTHGQLAGVTNRGSAAHLHPGECVADRGHERLVPASLSFEGVTACTQRDMHTLRRPRVARFAYVLEQITERTQGLACADGERKLDESRTGYAP
jgi:hypothetical protein